ncbi:hypothetical protein Hanom_Chr01g00046901 [Helianthus anomalus]
MHWVCLGVGIGCAKEASGMPKSWHWVCCVFDRSAPPIGFSRPSVWYMVHVIPVG